MKIICILMQTRHRYMDDNPIKSILSHFG
jgi:hypothetical protein